MDDTFQVPGFKANGLHCGIKDDGQKDLCLIYSRERAVAAGVFTRNAFKAAPVLLDMARIGSGVGQAFVVNSGCANAATGEEGLRDARVVSEAVSRALKIQDDLVYVASTGVIGHRLPVRKIEKAIPELVSGLRETGWHDAEEAIMTTDKFPKMSMTRAEIGGRMITVCGLAKGAGMIEPNMATMLSFLVTDALIEADTLNKLFKAAVEKSFNSVTVDGCMSTNDTALILANGFAGGKAIADARSKSLFKAMLAKVLGELAYQMVRDGEGATKVIDIRVEEAKSVSAARKVAYAVANSNLVKTAFYGGDPNWGRIIAAIGAVGDDIPVNAVRVTFEGIPIFEGGRGVVGNEREVQEVMAMPRITVCIHMGMGGKSFRVLASDLTHEYVTINAHYHT